MPFDSSFITHNSSLPLWGLVAARLAGFALLAPPFGYNAVPWPVRIGIGAVWALPVAGVAGADHPLTIPPAAYPAAWLAEAALGLLLGFAVATLFYGAEIAGSLISNGAWPGPTTSSPEDGNAAPLARLYLLLAVATLLLLNGHLVLIEGLCDSVKALPPGAWAVGGLGAAPVVAAVGQCFVTALWIAAPVLALLFAWELVAALIARAAPLWAWPSVAESVRPGAGLLAIALSLPLVWPTFVALPHAAAELLQRCLQSLGGG